jgi:hypothetical protein
MEVKYAIIGWGDYLDTNILWGISIIYGRMKMQNVLEDLIEKINESGEPIGKAGVKLIILCQLLKNVNWDRVDKFALKWEVLNVGTSGSSKLPVPVIYMTAGGETETFVGDETEEPK